MEGSIFINVQYACVPVEIPCLLEKYAYTKHVVFCFVYMYSVVSTIIPLWYAEPSQYMYILYMYM